MKNLKVGKKLFVAFAVILSLFVLSIVVGVSGIQMNAQALDDFYEQPFNVVNVTWSMREATVAIEKNIFWIVTSNDPAVVQKCKADIEANVAIVDDGINQLKAKYKGDPQYLTNYIQMTDLSILDQDKIVELALKLTDEANQEAIQLMEDVYLPEMDKATNELISMANEAQQRAVDYNNKGTDIKIASLVILCVLAFISIVVSIILGTTVTRGITRPIQEIENAAREMSKGNLKTKINYHSKDEMGSLSDRMRDTIEGMERIIGDVGILLGEMARGNFDVHTTVEDSYVGEFKNILLAMRNINTSLSETIAQINQASDQVASGSDQVSSGAQALSQGATEQASSVQELAATINEISGQVKGNAESAGSAREEADAVAREMLESNKQMQQMIEAMGEISSSSSEIGKIIKTIEDIAFQTNILALNAAVEAARAGAAGKGFAVVADEVRNLANKSSEASKNTAVLIEGSLKAVENGTKIADATAKSLLVAVEGAKRVTDGINRISAASTEQADSIAQVTQGIDQISSVVQTNSATAEESAAASEELSGQAQVLKGLVSRFRLKEGIKTQTLYTADQDAFQAPDMSQHMLNAGTELY